MSKKCGRCGKSVYAAEERIAGGKAWHKVGCFTCKSCGKSLDSSICSEKDGEIFCKSCHGKHFGPKGYGYGSGAGTLNMDAGTDEKGVPKWGGSTAPASTGKYAGSVGHDPSKHCGRCGKPVYEAEKVPAVGLVWHRQGCFTCRECKKRLEQGSFADNEKEIYCKGCYGKLFGAKGYGFGGGAGALTHTK